MPIYGPKGPPSNARFPRDPTRPSHEGEWARSFGKFELDVGRHRLAAGQFRPASTSRAS